MGDAGICFNWSLASTPSAETESGPCLPWIVKGLSRLLSLLTASEWIFWDSSIHSYPTEILIHGQLRYFQELLFWCNVKDIVARPRILFLRAYDRKSSAYLCI